MKGRRTLRLDIGNKGGKKGLGWTLGTAFIIGTFTLGPIDLPRTVYNMLIGDTPLIKSRLTGYVREGIKRKYPALDSSEVEQRLARELDVRLENDGVVDPQGASMEELWDRSEDYPLSGYGRWVWPSLKNDYSNGQETKAISTGWGNR